MSTPVMGHNAKALAKEEQQLRIPVIGAQRPAMVKVDHLGVAWPPVFVENLDPIFSCDVSHARVSCIKGWRGDRHPPHSLSRLIARSPIQRRIKVSFKV
ncbi:hypothetical protein D3C76_1516880 [compost metagenome]